MEVIAEFVLSLPWRDAGLAAFGGFIAAARQDRESFRRWIHADDPFNWTLAARRWAIGSVVGFLGVMLPAKFGGALLAVFGV